MSNTSEKRDNGATVYSPFWPIFIVFAVIALLQFFDTKNGFDRRKQLKAVIAEYDTIVPKATVLEQTAEMVGRDLLALSDGKTNEAAKIIAEFNIRLNANAPVPAQGAVPGAESAPAPAQSPPPAQ